MWDSDFREILLDKIRGLMVVKSRVPSETYTFRGCCITPGMMEPLQAYINDRRQVGAFLAAVLCNDLQTAVEMADEVNLANLPAYVGYLYNKAPGLCWGSKKKMEAWLAMEELSVTKTD